MGRGYERYGRTGTDGPPCVQGLSQETRRVGPRDLPSVDFINGSSNFPRRTGRRGSVRRRVREKEWDTPEVETGPVLRGLGFPGTCLVSDFYF